MSSSLDENKCLYVCTFETHRNSTPRRSYVVRSIKLSDLLSSSMSELKQVAILEKDDFQRKGACGVFGSKIVFASGVQPAMPRPTKDAYAFDVHDPNQGIVKMPALNGPKYKPPLITEFAGKLYVLSLSYRGYSEFVSFEVFDPDQATWSRLPEFPPIGGNVYSCAIAGSKLFASFPVPEDGDPYCHNGVFCFDLAASDPKWKKVPWMCQGGSLPFTGQALVVDLPQQPEYKLLFSLTKDVRHRNSLLVHLMSVVEGKEDVEEIMMEMPLPDDAQPRLPADCCLVHLGGNHVCLVNACIRKSYDPYLDPYGPKKRIDCTLQGAAIPFQFEFDISKIDSDTENCCTVKFLPSVKFEYYLRPDSTTPPRTFGCFVL